MNRFISNLAHLVANHPWRILFWLISLSILGWWGYQQSYSLWIRHHLRMAQEAEDQFDFERAYAELAICLKHRPEDAKVHLFAARIARRGIRFDEAEEHLAEAARLDKDEKALESVLRLESAMLFCQRGDLLHSQKFLEDSRQGDPPETNLILEALAGGCMQIGLIGKAKEYLDQLLERDPNHVIGLLWRGQLYDRRALTDKALADFQKAVDVLPDLPASRLFLGEFLLRLQKPNEALEHFEFLKKRTPHDARALLGWAQCQLALGNTEAAIDLLDEVLKLDPKYREALVQRASIALNANEPEKAEKWLRMAQELLPFDRDTNYQLALCLNKLGRHEEADEYNRKAQEEEKARKALEKLSEQQQKQPNNLDLRRQIGEWCFKHGKAKEGLQWMQGALQMPGDHRPIHAALAKYFEETGDTERAVRHRRLAGQ